MAVLAIHHIKVIAYTQEGEEVELFMGVPEHTTTTEILETLVTYHVFDSVEDMCQEWYQ